jgi:hypothetical protein
MAVLKKAASLAFHPDLTTAKFHAVGLASDVSVRVVAFLPSRHLSSTYRSIAEFC